MERKRRMTVKMKQPNPLFEQWLTEWRDKAKESGSKMEHCFSIALRSLKKYPLPLETGKDCKILHGFGDKLCCMLDDKLRKHRIENPLEVEGTEVGRLVYAGLAADDPVADSHPPKKKARRKQIIGDHTTPPKSPPKSHNVTGGGGGSASKEYVPQYGSGPYAILITLYKANVESNTTFMTKAEIIKRAQPLSTKSFLRPDPGTYYTAWSSMKTLLEKKLVIRQGNPAKFSLTPEGNVLADKLYVQYAIEKFKADENKLETDSVATIQASCSNSNTNPLGRSNGNKMNIGNSEGATAILKQTNGSSTSSSLSKRNPTMSTEGSVGNSVNHKSTKTVKLQPPSCNSLSRENSNGSVPTSSQASSNTTNHESIVLQPEQFEIVLLVDNQEVNGSKTNPETDPLCRELTSMQVLYEVRNLKVGDYLWIARDRKSPDNEVVLPYIIERKRMDDFGSSIKDGRFHEQKFRLKQCGLNHLIYLVESHGKNDHVGLPVSTLYQAASNTAVQDGFVVKFTEDLRDTVAYLRCLTKLIVKHYKNKTIASCAREDFKEVSVEDDLIFLMNFREFNKSSSKTKQFRVRDMFVRHLLQIKGLSVEKALAIVDKYPTPQLLRMAYQDGRLNGDSGKEKLLAALQYGSLGKKIGPVVSRTVYQFFCKITF